MSIPGDPAGAEAPLLDTRLMRYLLAVADAGSLTHAAAALGVAQPALSQALKRLETELGVRLFDRSRRGATLTEAGRAIIDDVRASLALAVSACGGSEEATDAEQSKEAKESKDTES